MSNMPSHGAASQMRAGNARENFAMGSKYGSMQGSYAPGMAGGRMMEGECQFSLPAPKRCYCGSAAFTSLDGRTHHRLLDAYGFSRPCMSYH